MSNIVGREGHPVVAQDSRPEMEYKLSKAFDRNSRQHFRSKMLIGHIYSLKKFVFPDVELLVHECGCIQGLMNELFQYFYTLPQFKEHWKDVLEIVKGEMRRSIKEASDCLLLHEGAEWIKRDFEKGLVQKEQEYKVLCDSYETPLNFSYFSSRSQQYILDMTMPYVRRICRACKDISKKIISIIYKFYADKSSCYDKTIMKRFDMLVKELGLTEAQKNILGYWTFSSRSLVMKVQFDAKSMKHLSQFGFCTSDGEILRSNIEWVQRYIQCPKGRVVDFVLNSEPLELEQDIRVEDYPATMRDKINNVKKLISNYKGKTPLNILLWGEPGCGKSTLVNLLQKEIGDKKFVKIDEKILMDNNRIMRDYDCQKNSNTFFETKSSLRMCELKICAAVSVGEKFVFVMDQSDDILNARSGGLRDNYLTCKKQINELLEGLRVPVIWVVNHKDSIEQSTCRRFQYSIQFQKLSVEQRENVWKKQIELTKTAKLMRGIDIRKFATRYDLTPGVICVVLSDLKLLKPEAENIEPTLESLIGNHLSLVGDVECKDSKIANNDKYDISGLNIKSQFSVDRIVPAIRKFEQDRLSCRAKNKNLCVLFNGPPGTGKTEFVKYIARQLNKELHYMVYSDVASCWIGQTEAMIRKAFDRAQKENAILFFDEADSLISSRGNAVRSWQITQTSEILTSMERFTGIFVASTNFLQSIDTAAMRRFQMKFEFDYLDDAGKQIFFERFFGRKISCNTELCKIDKLTPGDFKAVRDRLQFFEDNPTDGMIVQELRQQVKYKMSGKSIGF